MNLTSAHPFWFECNGFLNTYPFLDHDLECDVVVIGAGITGAIITYELSKLGRSIVVLDARDVCRGSTAATTALIQYEIDVPLVNMSKHIGFDKASRAYQLSFAAIDTLEQIVQESGAICDFQRKTSIYLASDRTSAKLLADEARMRKAVGLEVLYHRSDSVQSQFGLKGSAALTSHQAASCDPYRLSHGLLVASVRRGVQVFDRTLVEKFKFSDDGVTLRTSRGVQVKSKQVVIANGYEAQQLLSEQIVNLDNTYAVVSQPLASLAPWNADWMLWEAKEPYLYIRATADNRLLAGGEDDAFYSPQKRDRVVEQKSKAIRKKVMELIPGLDWEVDHSWAGTFGHTRDGLPYIGESAEFPNCYFALGFGGNGITFSTIASQLISSKMRDEATPDLELFRFGR